MGKITLQKISSELLDIDNEIGLIDNFVGIGIQINEEGFGCHSVIAIGVEREYYIFHFGFKTVDLEGIPHEGQKYFIKYINDIIDPEFSVSFLTHCKRIMQFPPPQYGHIFNNAYYDAEGKYISDNEVTNFATCVGFCINAITLFINSESYFELSDWTAEGMEEFEIEHPNYFIWFYEKFSINNPGINQEQFNDIFKRITPTEYTASAYISVLPIRKAEVDAIISDVKRALRIKIGID